MSDSSYSSTQAIVLTQSASKTFQDTFITTFSKKKLPKIFSIGYGTTPMFKSLKRMPNGMYETVFDSRTHDLMIEAEHHRKVNFSFHNSMMRLIKKFLK